MGAGLSGRSRRLGVLAGGFLLAVIGMSLVASSSHAVARTKSKPGTSCAHPVYSSQTLGGPAGDLKDFTVKFKVLSDSNPGSIAELTTEAVEVTVTNPKIVICSATVTDLGYNYTTGRYEDSLRHVYHVTIGPHGGLSSSITVLASANVVAEALARFEPTKGTKPTSGCTLDTIWDGVGDGGDKQDYSVKLKTTGSEPGPYTAQVEVKILNPNVEICSGSVMWYEGNGATGQHSAPVTIGVHGGVSSRVSLPANADGVAAKVLARLK